MGSTLVTYTHRNNPTTDELHERFNDEAEMAGEECGKGGYSGSLYEKSGLTIIDKTFSSSDEAYDHICDNNGKWDNAWAVPYKATVTVPKSTLTSKKTQLAKAEADLKKLETDAIKAIKGTKSKTIGCKSCGSSINRKYVRSLDCNVCGKTDAFKTETLKKRIKTKQDKIITLKAEVRNMSNETVKKQGINYVVGGWCSC